MLGIIVNCRSCNWIQRKAGYQGTPKKSLLDQEMEKTYLEYSLYLR